MISFVTFENCTVESFAFFLLNCNWKFIKFNFVNCENLFCQICSLWTCQSPKSVPKEFPLAKVSALKILMSIDLWVLMTSWVSHKFDYLMDNEKFSFSYIYSWIWMGMSFFWLGVCGCDLYMAGCGWVQVSVTFFRPGAGDCELSLAGFGWVWVGVGESAVYNCPTFFNFLTVLYLLDSEDQSFQEIVTYWFQTFMPKNTICTRPYFVIFLLCLFLILKTQYCDKITDLLLC